MKTVKYTFDNHFDTPPKQTQASESAAPMFSEEALVTARNAGFAEGIDAGRAEILSGIEEQVAQTADAIAASVQALAQEHEGRMTSARREAVSIAHAVARTLAPALASREPLAEIEHMVRECLAFCYTEPRLVVRVAEALVEPTKDLIDRLTRDLSFDGKIILLGDERLTGDQCRVEWADGGAERDQAALQEEVDRLVDRYLNGLTTPPSCDKNEPVEQQPLQPISENTDVE